MVRGSITAGARDVPTPRVFHSRFSAENPSPDMQTTSTLALLGGKPIRTAPFHRQNTIGEEEKRRVMDVLDSGVLSDFVGTNGAKFLGGPQVRAFEAAMAQYVGAAHAISMNSATSALIAAVGAAGVGPGDEVIVTPYTMSASATAAVVWGGVPVFADIDEGSFTLSADAVIGKISENTRAIVAVDLFGQPADFERLMAIAAAQGITVIEDAAQAPGAMQGSRMCGRLGHIGVYSLNYHKHVHTGEGGVALTDDPQLAERLQLIRNHAEVVIDDRPSATRVNMVGQNYRLTELQAAIGLAQLEKLPSLLRVRQNHCTRLGELLADNPVFAPPAVRPSATHAYYVYAVRYRREPDGPHRNRVAEALAAEGLPCRGGYVKPLYLMAMYRERIGMGRSGFPFNLRPHVRYEPGLCPIAERIQDHELIITEAVQSALNSGAVDDMARIFEKVAEHIDDLRE
jgi:perosamine synthetase